MTKSYQLYKHQSGQFFLVTGECTQTETGSRLILYRSVETGESWARSAAAFTPEAGYYPRMTLTPVQKKCLGMAAVAHAGQLRTKMAGVARAYITHPISVASRIAITYPDAVDAIAAAFLHDTIEDTPLRYDDICAAVGKGIADIVLEVTDDPALTKRAQKEAQIANAPGKSIAAKMVKCADKTDNCLDFVQAGAPNLIAIMCFSKKVVDGLRCPEIALLLEAFDVLFESVVPADTDIEAAAAEYLASKPN